MAAPRSPINPTMPSYHTPGSLLTDVQHPPGAGISNGQQYSLHMPVGPGDATMGGVMGQMSAMSLAGPGLAHGGGYSGPIAPAYVFPDNQYILAQVANGQQPMGMMDPSFGGPAYIAAPHPSQFSHAVLPYPSVVPFTPGRPSGAPSRSDRANGEAPPPLDSGRRGSYSTNESTPATPYYAGITSRDPGRVSIVGLDRSTYTTPSPQQGALLSLNTGHSVIAKQIPAAMDRDIDELLKQTPAVPKAVPAVFTPASQIKTLEQSLENGIAGNRNVYIRGLHPTTDDDLLLKYTERFGEVETSKAIIDTGTGACKGFGFAKFYDVRDSEKCIRGFHRLGYEVGFARESFNSRLKAEGDEASTNLYISNLPKHLTEMELSAIFAGYTIMSSKILRDSMGNSRGVGFARFENRLICDEIIKGFNGLPIATDTTNLPMVMNIRYADTPAQKELKRVTAERRQFRTNEYNIGAYGTPHVGMPVHAYGITTPYRRSYPTTAPGTPRTYITVNRGATCRSEQGSSAQAEQQLEHSAPAEECPSSKSDDDIKEEDDEQSKSDTSDSPSPSIKTDAI